MTLMDLTRQESGIVVYSDESVAVVNWSSLGENEFPMFGPLEIMLGWEESGDVFDGAEMRHVENITKEIPGSIWLTGDVDGDGCPIADTDLDIIQDKFDDLVSVFLDEEPTAGTVYALRDGRKIIAPDYWN